MEKPNRKGMPSTPVGEMAGARVKRVIVSETNEAPISGDEIALAIVDRSPKGGRKARQVCRREKRTIAEPMVGNSSGRDRASASQLSFPGICTPVNVA